jgi:hypothetical protein
VHITNKGFVFTTDLIFTIMILLVMLLVFVIFINNHINFFVQQEKNTYLEEKTIFTADSFVKNYNEENAMLGACFSDDLKKRVLSNEINSLNFSKIKQLELTDFFIKKIIVKNIFEKTIFESPAQSKNCFSIKRFVFVDNIKSEITFLGCLYE